MMKPTPPAPVTKTWQESVAESVGRAVQPVGRRPAATDVPPPPAATVLSVPAPARTPVFTELSYELLDRLEWKRLELIVALYFGQTGIRAECTCIGADGGVDVQLYRTGEQTPYCFVQCKAISWKVDVKLVRELLGVMSSAKISQGMFVTTGRYTKDALSFAAQNNIQAIHGHEFVERFNQLPHDARRLVLAKVTEGDYTTPTCSRCDIKMLLKDTIPPQWNCRRCNGRLYVRKLRWSTLRATKR